MQELYSGLVDRLVTAMHATTAYDPASRVASVRQAAMLWSEITYFEKRLSEMYRQHLPAIRAAAGH
jgi:hypothetical protein